MMRALLFSLALLTPSAYAYAEEDADNSNFHLMPHDKFSVAQYHRAAELGVAQAQYQLGRMYQKGYGVEPSPKQAAAWLRKAMEQGHELARRHLELMQSGRKNK